METSNNEDPELTKNTEQNEYPATRQNYLRITREITDSTNEKFNPTYEFDTDIKRAILEYGPQKRIDQDPEDEDTNARTEDANTHLRLMRHIMAVGNIGSKAEQFPEATRGQMRDILRANPPPYYDGNKEYNNDITINIPTGTEEQTFKQGCTHITQYII